MHSRKQTQRRTRYFSYALAGGLLAMALMTPSFDSEVSAAKLFGKNIKNPFARPRPKPPAPKPAGKPLKTGSTRARKPTVVNPLTMGMRTNAGSLAAGGGRGTFRPQAPNRRAPGSVIPGNRGRPSNVTRPQYMFPLPPRPAGGVPATTYRGNGVPNPRAAAAVAPRRNLEAMKAQRRPEVFAKLPQGFHRLANPRMGVIPGGLKPRPSTSGPLVTPTKWVSRQTQTSSNPTGQFQTKYAYVRPQGLPSFEKQAAAAQRQAVPRQSSAQMKTNLYKNYNRLMTNGPAGTSTRVTTPPKFPRPPLRRTQPVKNSLDLVANPAMRKHVNVTKRGSVYIKPTAPFNF